MNENCRDLEQRLGYQFGCRDYLREALTHPSFCAEYDSDVGDNQRLEFLGDAVVQIAVTARLFKDFPNLREGELTKLRATITRTETLADFARHLGMGEFLRLGHGEARNDGRERTSNLADAFEAVIGAVFLDQAEDIRAAVRLIEHLIHTLCPDMKANLIDDNPKGALQEWCQKRWHEQPEYELVEESGPDHEKTFVVHVIIKGACYGTGSANRRRNAEQDAAAQALARIEKESAGEFI